MYLVKHFINCRRAVSASQILRGPYPIGLSLEQFLFLFNDVKAFFVSGTAITDTSLLRAVRGFTIEDALNALGDDPTNVVSFTALARRRINQVGVLRDSGEELP